MLIGVEIHLLCQHAELHRIKGSWTFGNDDGANARLTAIAKRYVENFADISSRPDLNGIVFYGAVGTGKTYIEDSPVENGKSYEIKSGQKITVGDIEFRFGTTN